MLELWEALLLETSETPIQDSERTFQSLLQSSPVTAQAIEKQNEFILQNISSNQREYYQQAVAHLNSYKPYVFEQRISGHEAVVFQVFVVQIEDRWDSFLGYERLGTSVVS